MNEVSQERAILFADVSGSTRLYELLGDKPAQKAIETCLACLAEEADKHRGRVVKTIGDEIMVVFPRAADAANAAHDMQHRVKAMPAVSGQFMRIRIGFHFGPVLEEKNDFFGDGVNVAARIAGLAKAGQVLTSASTVESMSAWQRRNLRALADFSVKGKAEALDLYELMWEDDEEATQVIGTLTVSRPASTLKLAFRGKDIVFPPAATLLAIGRDPSGDVVLTGKNASRRHARIEYRRNQYFLVDESTNGTFVTFDGDAELLLRREQVLLRGSGLMSFGSASTDPDAETLRFTLG
jgi:class 3 adenylate cyclase